MERQLIKKALLESQFTRGNFKRDYQSTRGAFPEKRLTRGKLLERESIDKEGTFGETIDKGELLERQLTRGKFKRDN